MNAPYITKGDDEFVSLVCGCTRFLGSFLLAGDVTANDNACSLVYDTLWIIDPDTNEIRSDVLEDWYYEDDLTFVIKLKEGVTIKEGETLGIVGESGCGKSTLGRTLIRLLDSTEGTITFDGKDITNAKGKDLLELRKQAQIIFQDPFSSLNPRLSVHELIADPLKIFHLYKNKDAMTEKIHELMDLVGLAKRFEFSYPHELDGGRRQRIGIARALALEPKFIVCDEPVSALDMSIQAQILNLLQDLQESKHLTYVFITHDLSVVKHISNNILVMYTGTMVEKCGTDELFDRPLHPYTKGLLSAIPIPSLDAKRERVIMKGEITSPIEPKPGCRFATRCPYATEVCSKTSPQYEELFPGHFVSCHNVREINKL